MRDACRAAVNSPDGGRPLIRDNVSAQLHGNLERRFGVKHFGISFARPGVVCYVLGDLRCHTYITDIIRPTRPMFNTWTLARAFEGVKRPVLARLLCPAVKRLGACFDPAVKRLGCGLMALKCLGGLCGCLLMVRLDVLDHLLRLLHRAPELLRTFDKSGVARKKKSIWSGVAARLLCVQGT